MDEGWQGFNIPFVLQLNDSMYQAPGRPPSFAMLRKEPTFDPYTGEEIGKQPEVHIHLDRNDTRSFLTFAKKSQDHLDHIRLGGSRWHFVDIALGMLTKAFFSDGLDQLLWHITVLEALFGSRDAILASISRRASVVLGRKGEEKSDIKDRLKHLYDFRSCLVHGRGFEKDVCWGHLREARDFARRSLIWSLNLLAMIQTNLPQKNPAELVPKRDLILNLLDLTESERR